MFAAAGPEAGPAAYEPELAGAGPEAGPAPGELPLDGIASFGRAFAFAIERAPIDAPPLPEAEGSSGGCID